MNIDIKAFLPYLSIICLFFVIAGSHRCFKYGGKKKALAYIPIALLLIGVIIAPFISGFHKGLTGGKDLFPVIAVVLICCIGATAFGIYLFIKFKPPSEPRGPMLK